jgi:hypothetical protein
LIRIVMLGVTGLHVGIQLCGLDPLLKDVLRITQLEREFDVYADEAEALGLIVYC